MYELAMQFLDDAGMVQDDFGDERPGLEKPTPLALEEIPLGAHHRTAAQHRRQIRHGSSSLLPAPRGHAGHGTDSGAAS
jgi:hypothetical protein